LVRSSLTVAPRSCSISMHTDTVSNIRFSKLSLNRLLEINKGS